MGAAAAFDHLQQVVDFVGAVHIHRQPHHVVEMDFGNAVQRHQLGAARRSRYRAFHFLTALPQRFDKEIDGAAGADADVFVVRHEFHRFDGGFAFELVLSAHNGSFAWE